MYCHYVPNTLEIRQGTSRTRLTLTFLQSNIARANISPATLNLYGKLEVETVSLQKQSPRGVLLKRSTCEFWEMSKNTFSYRTPPVAASEQLSVLAFKTLYFQALDIQTFNHFIFNIK